MFVSCEHYNDSERRVANHHLVLDMDITIYHDPANIETHIRKCQRLNKGDFAEPDKS